MKLTSTYDSGALIAAEQDDDRMWALNETAPTRAMRVTVPAGVLAQAWRGGPQPDCLNCSRDSRFLCARAATSDV